MNAPAPIEPVITPEEASESRKRLSYLRRRLAEGGMSLSKTNMMQAELRELEAAMKERR